MGLLYYKPATTVRHIMLFPAMILSTFLTDYHTPFMLLFDVKKHKCVYLKLTKKKAEMVFDKCG